MLLDLLKFIARVVCHLNRLFARQGPQLDARLADLFGEARLFLRHAQILLFVPVLKHERARRRMLTDHHLLLRLQLRAALCAGIVLCLVHCTLLIWFKLFPLAPTALRGVELGVRLRFAIDFAA